MLIQIHCAQHQLPSEYVLWGGDAGVRDAGEWCNCGSDEDEAGERAKSMPGWRGGVSGCAMLPRVWWLRNEAMCSSLWIFSCFLRSCGRLNDFGQNYKESIIGLATHLITPMLIVTLQWCGFRGTWTRRWLVMWSRLITVTSQFSQWQVKQRLPVDFRPTWSFVKWL